MNTKEILTFTVNVGSLMLSSGAEIYRVKETIVHILNGLAVEEFDVYVVSNGIFASAHENREDACSVIRNITKAEMHSGKISAINQLSRDIYTKRWDYTLNSVQEDAQIAITWFTNHLPILDEKINSINTSIDYNSINMNYQNSKYNLLGIKTLSNKKSIYIINNKKIIH